MIESFANDGTRDIFSGRSTQAARRALPAALHKLARRKLAILDYADELETLRVPPGNRLEMLRGSRKGQFSIRINEQYRVAFRWKAGKATSVEIVDYH